MGRSPPARCQDPRASAREARAPNRDGDAPAFPRGKTPQSPNRRARETRRLLVLRKNAGRQDRIPSEPAALQRASSGLRSRQGMDQDRAPEAARGAAPEAAEAKGKTDAAERPQGSAHLPRPRLGGLLSDDQRHSLQLLAQGEADDLPGVPEVPQAPEHSHRRLRGRRRGRARGERPRGVRRS